jgi:hypothetical protein
MRKTKTTQAVLSAALCLALVSPTSADEKPWDSFPKIKCSEVITPADEFTPLTPALLTWVVGYLTGMKAVSALDKRLKTLSEMSETAGAMVLAYCAQKQDDTVLLATTSVAELLINAMPGKRMGLDWR